jgi:predicted small secreted protein
MRRTILVCAAVAAAAVLGGCAHNPARTDGGGMDYDGLAAALRTQGAMVQRGGPIDQPFLSIPGRFLGVNGEDVQVFEYRDAEAARAEAARVSPDGGAIGTSRPFWAAPPHFYRRDRVIVLYVGEAAAVRTQLEAVLGAQFAGR